MFSEEKLIERVRRRLAAKPTTGTNGSGAEDAILRLGIGDDAAILRPRSRSEWVVTTDAFLENVHFLRKVHPPEAVSYKALARAASDLAAMGARSGFFFMMLALPDALTGSWLDGFLAGMARAARRFGLILAGGDTTKYPLAAITLTILGEIDRGKAILRSGARPGDLLCVTGRLGEAELGLRLIQRKLHKQKRWAKLLKKHLYPEPRLALGNWLASHQYPTAMIDTSDGLSTDLRHLCQSSGVGAILWSSKIPKAAIPPDLRRLNLDPLEMALNGGEDYELLFTVPKKRSGRLPRNLEGVPITVIGEITTSRGILVVDAFGKSCTLRPNGWDPFRRR
jgi:thiamine-monophosphate kinase